MTYGSMTTAPARAPRFALVDLVRGLAIVGVVFYHFSWDLGFFHYIATDVAAQPVWRGFARLLAGTFLALVGVGLVLAHRDGIRWRAFGKRLGIIAGAAAAISLATWIVFPQAFVFFGILHAIALFSVLALPFLRLPAWIVAAVALVVLLMPLWVALPALDTRWLAWIGMVRDVPVTNDYEPLFPWFGVTLFGIVLARLVLGSRLEATVRRWQPRFAPSRWLTRVGRWTLVIYLLHQPVLFGSLYVIASVFPPSPAMERAAFMQSCEASCVRSGGDRGVCRGMCTCSADGFDREGLWPLLRSTDLTNEERDAISRITGQCYFGTTSEPSSPGAGQ